MRRAIYTAAIVMAILHQDVWFWESTTLVFGFLPIGLAYHALFSIAAACLWALAIRFAWPATVEDFAHGGEGEGQAP